jgi:hypothetical protein
MRLRTPLLALALFLLSCGNDDGGAAPIFLAADPGSLLVGETVTATVKASEPFFVSDLTAAIASEGGLSLDSLVVQDGQTAIAQLTATAETSVGAHAFTLTQGGNAATLDVSVLNESVGPGTVTAEGDTATAGAKNATLTIHGAGTKFDAAITIEVQGADGFEIADVALESETWLDVAYSISIDQAPTEATIIIHDGAIQYELPFTIVSPLSLETTVAEQALTKGRVGLVTFSNADAELSAGTQIADAPAGVESGEAQFTSETEVAIPVRVPFDATDDTVVLEAHTYTQGGAFLEIMTAEVPLLEPAWLAVSPSRLAASVGAQEISLAAAGFDLTAVESLTLEGDGIALASWSAASATEGAATLAVTVDATVDGYVLVADDGTRAIHGVVAYPGSGIGVFRSEDALAAGDHGYIALVLVGGDLDEADVALASEGAFDVEGLHFIDSGCVVAELSSDASAAAGLQTLTLSSGGSDYEVHIAIAESGI